MPRKRKAVTICFRTEEEYRDAIAKSKERKRTLSGQIQHFFKKLPRLKRA